MNTKLLSACFIALFSISAFAVDTDSDGVDDSIDAFPTHPEATIDTDGDGKPDSFLFVPLDNFSDGSLGGTGMPWVTSGGWNVVSFRAHTNQADTNLTLVQTVPTTILTFKVGGNIIDCCYFEFYVDGARQYSSSDIFTTTGMTLSFPLSSGTHTLKWTTSNFGGFGGAPPDLWIDDVKLSNHPVDLIEDTDDDNDSVLDVSDACPLDSTGSVGNNDHDTWCDASDLDDDNDTILDVSDNCPLNANIDQFDTDGDGQGDACDTDDDNDGLLDASDNCPLIANINQLDSDGDMQGDVCDATPYMTDTVASIAVGAQHSCALMNSGGVKCWGDNRYGQLGNNSTINKLTPVDVVGVGGVGLLGGVTAIAAGQYHTCVLMSTGGVKCWGYNGNGALGNNSTVQKLTPVDVMGVGGVGLLGGVTAIAAGHYHTCALMSTGGVKCWGKNSYGGLGDNTTVDKRTPVDVVGFGGVGLLSNVMSITAGYGHTCVVTSVGSMLCWGEDNNGQLGDNSPSAYKLTQVSVNGLDSGVTAIAASFYSSCALVNTGGVTCWGNNHYGQVGDNSIVDKYSPTAVTGLNSGVTAITTSNSHVCALTDGGGVKCWGYNNNGQIGDNSIVNKTTPVDVVDINEAAPLRGVMAIAAGGVHTCALTSGGGVKCWGYNNMGQIGDNSTVQKLTPIFVVGLSGDTDGDGIGNNADTDDDGDGMDDIWETANGLNSLVNDANGDADGDGYTNLQEYLNGTNPQDSLSHPVISVKNDYTNSKIAGFYWKGDSNGVETQNQIWQLTFPLYSANYAIPTRFYPPQFTDQANWEIQTTGDFNKDGDADVLWRNKTTAQWKVWQMQNGTRAAQNTLADFDLAHEWTVVGAGDTDKDGDDDVILNNTTTGEVLIWEMQNHAITSTHSVGTKAGYTVNRIGDFNNDGDIDLLFRQNGADALITWEIQSNAFVTERALANTGAGYNPVCAGDFDNDGDDDILLLNSTDNQEKWFVMQNYTRTQTFGSANIGFRFISCGDYDGDGDMDTLWQRTSDDANRVVLQQNYGTTKQTVYTNAFGGVSPANAGYGYVYRGNSN